MPNKKEQPSSMENRLCKMKTKEIDERYRQLTGVHDSKNDNRQ
jgi:hypothetical protein